MIGMRSGEVAAAAGVNPQTLRYYERRGLLSPPDRTPGGHRAYRPEAVTTIRVIKAAQRLGFTLDEIANLVDTTRHHHADLQARLTQKLTEIEGRITDLEIIRNSLSAAARAGCTDLATCSEIPDCPLPFGRSAAGQ